jgi:hypothetical protein
MPVFNLPCRVWPFDRWAPPLSCSAKMKSTLSCASSSIIAVSKVWAQLIPKTLTHATYAATGTSIAKTYGSPVGYMGGLLGRGRWRR